MIVLSVLGVALACWIYYDVVAAARKRAETLVINQLINCKHSFQYFSSCGRLSECTWNVFRSDLFTERDWNLLKLVKLRIDENHTFLKVTYTLILIVGKTQHTVANYATSASAAADAEIFKQETQYLIQHGGPATSKTIFEEKVIL